MNNYILTAQNSNTNKTLAMNRRRKSQYNLLYNLELNDLSTSMTTVPHNFNHVPVNTFLTPSVSNNNNNTTTTTTNYRHYRSLTANNIKNEVSVSPYVSNNVPGLRRTSPNQQQYNNPNRMSYHSGSQSMMNFNHYTNNNNNNNYHNRSYSNINKPIKFHMPVVATISQFNQLNHQMRNIPHNALELFLINRKKQQKMMMMRQFKFANDEIYTPRTHNDKVFDNSGTSKHAVDPNNPSSVTTGSKDCIPTSISITSDTSRSDISSVISTNSVSTKETRTPDSTCDLSSTAGTANTSNTSTGEGKKINTLKHATSGSKRFGFKKIFKKFSARNSSSKIDKKKTSTLIPVVSKNTVIDGGNISKTATSTDGQSDNKNEIKDKFILPSLEELNISDNVATLKHDTFLHSTSSATISAGTPTKDTNLNPNDKPTDGLLDVDSLFEILNADYAQTNNKNIGTLDSKNEFIPFIIGEEENGVIAATNNSSDSLCGSVEENEELTNETVVITPEKDEETLFNEFVARLLQDFVHIQQLRRTYANEITSDNVNIRYNNVVTRGEYKDEVSVVKEKIPNMSECVGAFISGNNTNDHNLDYNPMEDKITPGKNKTISFSASVVICDTFSSTEYERKNSNFYGVNDVLKMNNIATLKYDLNSFKNYEMMVHKDSVTNTHFLL
ncbi:Afr1p SCDLUD_001648 [Saccharomycodes ludwigii]|uniref:Afr1p n=1 Tax=Saccharomycodes ludwigii TaxID=36035 RepID=UPI001E8A3A23|nr:hypothetical protein SCDLUD_001648 [Saccharomycodes ludwigii]KAH3901865.1 hypothetical protein SCDLUD_001648 [Saccharomycodes ludwigii]